MDQSDEYNLSVWFEYVAQLCAEGDFDQALIEVSNATHALTDAVEERKP